MAVENDSEEFMDFGLGETKEVPQTTIKDLDNMCALYSRLRLEAEEIEEKLTAKNEELKELGTKIMNNLNEFKKPSWKCAHGNFIINNRFTVPTPKTPEEKQAFFGYLKEKGIFEDMVTVHSQTLNGYFRQEMDAALDRGEIDFKMPGIGEPKYVQTLAMRKK
jgi:hypothetical protein